MADEQNSYGNDGLYTYNSTPVSNVGLCVAYILSISLGRDRRHSHRTSNVVATTFLVLVLLESHATLLEYLKRARQTHLENKWLVTFVDLSSIQTLPSRIARPCPQIS